MSPVIVGSGNTIIVSGYATAGSPVTVTITNAAGTVVETGTTTPTATGVMAGVHPAVGGAFANGTYTVTVSSADGTSSATVTLPATPPPPATTGS